jgi:hypothetical protein
MFDSLFSLMVDAGYAWMGWDFAANLDERYIFSKGKLTIKAICQIGETLLIGCPDYSNACFLFDPYLEQCLEGDFGKYLKSMEEYCPQTKIVGFVRDNPTDFFIYYSRDLKATGLGQSQTRLRIVDLKLMTRLETICNITKNPEYLFTQLVYDGDVDSDPKKFESWLNNQLDSVLAKLVGITA